MTGVPAPSRRPPTAGPVLAALSAALLLGAFLAPLGTAGATQAPAAGQDAYRIEINGGMPLFSEAPEVTVAGSTDAPAGSTVEVSIDAAPLAAATAAAEVTADGHWSLRWP